jgi:hypothetical protein
VGLRNTFVHGSANDPAVAWLEQDGTRIDVQWSSGLTARFGPELAIIGADGEVRMREGDAVVGACITEINGIRSFLLTLE